MKNEFTRLVLLGFWFRVNSKTGRRLESAPGVLPGRLRGELAGRGPLPISERNVNDEMVLLLAYILHVSLPPGRMAG